MFTAANVTNTFIQKHNTFYNKFGTINILKTFSSIGFLILMMCISFWNETLRMITNQI